MTRTARMLQPVIKEIRGLSLAWLACVVVIVAIPVIGFPWSGVGVFAYSFGSAALGALSIGHEYMHGTLGLLLSQPARRARLFLVKMCVLAAMLFALSTVAGAVLVFPRAPFDELGSSYSSQMLAFFLMPVLCGLCIAPWLTMATRSPIAGTVFSAPLLLQFLFVAEILRWAKYVPTADFETFRLGLLWWGTAGTCALGTVMSWRMFVRLEAIEGRGPDVRLPRWLRARTHVSPVSSTLTRQHPVWLLVTKELRLQQMPLVIGGLYVLGWLPARTLSSAHPRALGVFYVLTMFYIGAIAILIGSHASAEERQLGTLEWQVLMPISTAKQWIVKLGVVLGLALLLGFGLPALLAVLSPVVTTVEFPARFFVPPVVGVWVTLLAVGSLYVSSLCSSSLKAALLSLPAMLGLSALVAVLIDRWGSAVLAIVFPWFFTGFTRPQPAMTWLDQRSIALLVQLLALAFAALVLRFALVNHRSADQTAGRVWTQIIWMTGCLTIAATLLAGVAAL